MLSSFEQRIYNEHLRSSRSAAGKPYKLRKDFNDIDATTEVYLKRISRILLKFTNISIVDYFHAPYDVYGKDEFFDLKFYTSPRALKAYSIYMQRESGADPDSDVILQRVLASLQHLKEFCTQHQLTFEQYVQHKTGDLPTFVVHLKERKLSTYIMIELTGTLSLIKQQDGDVMRFMFGEKFYENLNTYKARLLSSKKCKLLIRAGLNKIEKSVVSAHTSR